jgi:hypothetical protein
MPPDKVSRADQEFLMIPSYHTVGLFMVFSTADALNFGEAFYEG